jgi:hypothetical protein
MDAEKDRPAVQVMLGPAADGMAGTRVDRAVAGEPASERVAATGTVDAVQ